MLFGIGNCKRGETCYKGLIPGCEVGEKKSPPLQLAGEGCDAKQNGEVADANPAVDPIHF